MGGIATEMVRLAVDATLSGELELAARVIAMDDEVDRLEKDVLKATILSVALEAPVAADLMMLISTLGIAGEIEKVGDDAVKLARRATKLVGHFPVEMKLALRELGIAATKMFAGGIRLYVDYSPELADAIVDDEQAVDAQYSAARNRVFELIERTPSETEHLVRTIEAFHALEHVADHAVEIARRLRLQQEV